MEFTIEKKLVYSDGVFPCLFIPNMIHDNICYYNRYITSMYNAQTVVHGRK